MNDTELRQAISEATGSAMVVNYVVVAECIGEDGVPYLADLTSPGLPYWTAMGMAHSLLSGHAPQPAWSENSEN